LEFSQTMSAEKASIPGKDIKATLIGVASAVMLVLVITGALHMRAANTADLPDKVPLPVATTVYRLQDSFQRDVSYLGVVAAGRRANLAFEVPGRIASLLVRQGSPVAAGDVLATLDDARLQSARRAAMADLTQAEADLELARLKAKRQADLVQSGSVSREAFDETRLQAQALQARVESITARLEGIDIDLEDSQLVAPYEGVIADRYLNEGTVANAGQPVVRLVETGRREAHIGVVAERAARLQQGSTYNLSLRGQVVPATLLSVRPDIDPVTRVATAVFALPDGTEALDGESVYLLWKETVDLRGGWLPLTALLEGERGVWTLMRLEPRGQVLVALREGVEVLEVRGEQAYVIGTVSDGDRVVSMGAHRVVPGTPVSDTGAP
jgi:RND family efflux transporter MFP subunit